MNTARYESEAERRAARVEASRLRLAGYAEAAAKLEREAAAGARAVRDKRFLRSRITRR